MEKTLRILLFAGTTEGRILWEYCNEHKISATAAVATEYGEAVLPQGELSHVLVGRMDREQMADLIKKGRYRLVIDATHPYAKEATENIKAACRICGIQYIRIIRESLPIPDAIYVRNLKEAADYLNRYEGRALITTGSKELEAFTKVTDYTKRLTVRILPDYENLKHCMELGFTGSNIICMQGPFSEELNLAVLKEIKASYLVTKESGSFGGFPEKVRAAGKAGAKVIVISRPEAEEGHTCQEAMAVLECI